MVQLNIYHIYIKLYFFDFFKNMNIKYNHHIIKILMIRLRKDCDSIVTFILCLVVEKE